MADIWLPGYTRVDLGWRGAPYDETAHPKLLWHTTEGSSMAGARAAFRNYPPHGCYDPWTDTAEQYIPLNYHSWSLLGSEADDEYVIQWEIVGFAGQSHTWPEHLLERLGRRVAGPIAAAVGVPAQHLRFYRADEGIVLARPTSPIRLSLDGFRAFSGHLGHQHAPAPDGHWDPGGLRIDRILAYATEEDMAALDDINARLANIEGFLFRGGPSTGDGPNAGVAETSVAGRVEKIQITELARVHATLARIEAALPGLSRIRLVPEGQITVTPQTDG